MQTKAAISPKKIIIISIVTFLLITISIVIVNTIDGSALRIRKTYDVRSDFPFLVVCFNKTVNNDSSHLEMSDFTIKNKRAKDPVCASFLLSTKEGGISKGHYVATLSVESESGHTITNKEIAFEVVDGVGENTLKNDEIGALVDANNDADIEEWMGYWRSQPIYQHVDPQSFAYKGAMWSIALRTNDNGDPAVMIYLNMPEPSRSRPALIESVEQYKKAAINEIRGWGVNPDDYLIEYKFTK